MLTEVSIHSRYTGLSWPNLVVRQTIVGVVLLSDAQTDSYGFPMIAAPNGS